MEPSTLLNKIMNEAERIQEKEYQKSGTWIPHEKAVILVLAQHILNLEEAEEARKVVEEK